VIKVYQKTDLTGQVFGDLTASSFSQRKGSGALWWCECACGRTTRASKSDLLSGRAWCCEHCKSKLPAIFRHGLSVNGITPPEYKAYINARTRATNPRMPGSHNYYDRGIKFHFKTFGEWFAELGLRPSEEHSVDRIDNNGHYEVGNVRWATSKEQTRNKRNNRIIEFQGRTQCLMDWAKEIGITFSALSARLGRLGWSLEKALTTPNQKTISHQVKSHD
jgi:hypothetical protein